MVNISEHSKLAVDSLSLSAAIATLAGWLPALAALFSIIWTAIRIYETKTVQMWLGQPIRRRAVARKAAIRGKLLRA